MPLSAVHCARVPDPGFPGQPRADLPRAYLRVSSFTRPLAAQRIRQVGAHRFRDRENSAPAPAPALTPNPTSKPLSPDLPARRQAGFDSLSAAPPATCAPSLSDTSARSRPPVPYRYRAAALDLFPWGQDGRRARRPAPAGTPRTDIATELDLDHDLSLPSAAAGHLVDCGSSGGGRRCNLYVEPTPDEVGESPGGKQHITIQRYSVRRGQRVRDTICPGRSSDWLGWDANAPRSRHACACAAISI